MDPGIVGLPRKGVADQSIVLREIVRDALTKAPQPFIATVKKMLRLEKERDRPSTGGSTRTLARRFSSCVISRIAGTIRASSWRCLRR